MVEKETQQQGASAKRIGQESAIHWAMESWKENYLQQLAKASKGQVI